MKKLVILCALFSSYAFAADLNLKGGESAIIEPNTSTRVTCGGSSSGGGGTCTEIVSGFQSLIDSCEQSYNGGYCAEKLWPTFKAANSRCAYAGISVCLKACLQSYNGGYCADKCQ